jgi:hypothetical protein
MYFPYLRGKQFELLALRELCPLMSQRFDKISPIIEPVKSTTGLINCVVDLRKHNINFNVIINPTVGDMKGKTSEILKTVSHKLTGYDNYQIAIIVSQSVDYIGLLRQINEVELRGCKFTFIHNEVKDNIREIQQQYAETGPVINNVINFKRTGRRYHREFDQPTRVSLDDYFGSLPKNADYLNQDSYFNDDYKFYLEEGYRGFGDFLTIGDIYLDKRGLPWAVVIHISYADEMGRIRVKHFVSDTNDDATNVAGKFAEANRKLVEWCDEREINTIAVNRFRLLNETDHYPGLGTIKKLSIMNHIELMLSLI